MSSEGLFVLGVIGLVTAALMSRRIGVDTAMVGGLLLLLLADQILGGDRILPIQEGLSGFSHKAVVMIGALYVVAAGLRETGGVHLIAGKLLGRPKGLLSAQLRLMIPVGLLSGLMNNTPLVAMYLPILGDWCRRLRLSPSRLFIPLSYAAIFGGALTAIGTSSNIVILEMLLDYEGEQDVVLAASEAPLRLVENGVPSFLAIGAVGLPLMMLGIVGIALTNKKLLPERQPAEPPSLDTRDYQLAMRVRSDAPFVGKTVEAADLRHLPGVYLTRIEREGRDIPAPGPEETVLEGDLLWFTGVLDSVRDLRNIRGLEMLDGQARKVQGAHQLRTLVEAVVSWDSEFHGKSVRDIGFRTRFNAAIIAVRRGGVPLEGKIGDMVLERGDTLLLDTNEKFLSDGEAREQFDVISRVQDSRPPNHRKAQVALAIVLAMVLGIALAPVDSAVIALTAAGLMVLSRCLPGRLARAAIDYPMLLVIGAAIGIGRAMEHTGAAEQIAEKLLMLAAPYGPLAILSCVYVLAVVFGNLISNNSAAVLVFPVAFAASQSVQLAAEPFAAAVILGASSTFLSPVSYPTNLMVYGPGGYHFLDYARVGLPLVILRGLLMVLLIPIFFPFQ